MSLPRLQKVHRLTGVSSDLPINYDCYGIIKATLQGMPCFAVLPQHFVEPPMSRLLIWSRSIYPHRGITARSQNATPPIMDLTVDSDGINRLERRFHTSEHSRECYNRPVLIVENEASSPGFIMRLKVRIREYFDRFGFVAEWSPIPHVGS